VAVTDEQRALLQLLLEGGQSYEDIGSLLGIGPDEVRSRARSALSEIGGADPDAQVGLSDYLLGQADPIGRADAVRHLQADPDANALAERLVQHLRLLAPKAQLPEIPAAKGGRRTAPAAAAPPAPPAGTTAPPPGAPPPATPQAAPAGPGIASRAAGALSGLGGVEGKRRTQLIVGAAAALAIAIVLLVVVTGGGGDEGGGDCQTVDTSAPQQGGVPTIKLAAVGSSADADCPPSGQMTLGAAPQQAQQQSNQAPTYVFQANAVELPPTGESDRYVLWLYRSDTQAVPLGQQTVSDSGDLTGAVPLAAQQVLLLPAFDKVRFSKVTQAQAEQVQQSLQAQRKKATGIVPFTGEPVLEGSISELGLDQLLQQAQQQAQSQAGGSGKKG
jgi:hypothetical protein